MNMEVCSTCHENLAKNHYLCKGPCAQIKCRQFFSRYFASNDKQHSKQQCDSCQEVCATCHENLAKNHYICKGPCGLKKCKNLFSNYFAINHKQNGKQQCDSCQKEKNTARTKEQDVLRTDFCPKCGQLVHISKAQGTMNLKHKSADGKPCRYKAAVVEWKIKR